MVPSPPSIVFRSLRPYLALPAPRNGTDKAEKSATHEKQRGRLWNRIDLLERTDGHIVESEVVGARPGVAKLDASECVLGVVESVESKRRNRRIEINGEIGTGLPVRKR